MPNTQAVKPVRVPFNEDNEVVAYQFINVLKTKEGIAVMSNGHESRVLSALYLGGGGEGYDASSIQAGIADHNLTAFVNGSVIVIKKRTGGSGSKNTLA